MGDATLNEWETKNELASKRIQELLRILSKSKMLHVIYVFGTIKDGLRFSEIKKSSQTDSTTLTRRLSELEDIGIIERKELCKNSTAVEYHVTNSFDIVKPILNSLLHYGLKEKN